MRFDTAAIDRYGPLQGCRPACDDGISIVAGPNESGKTLYLEGILQLLEPDITDHMSPQPRVHQPPTGRVVVEDGADRHVLGNGTGLSDISRIEPNHLYNLFVIRDSDLTLPDGSEYYTSLVEHLGDIHTSEIEAIRAGLVQDGRLTPGRLDLSNREYETKETKRTADSLASEIETYLDSAEEQGVRETVRERLQIQRQLATVEDQLATQRTAKERAEFEDASGQLQEYRDATEEIRDLDGFQQETLDQLRSQNQELSHTEDRITDIESDLESKRSDVERLRDELTEARDRHAGLQQRESDVEHVESILESYRDQVEAGGSFDSRLAQRRYLTGGGLVGAGVAAGGGVIAGSVLVIAFGVILFLVAVGAWISHRRLTRRAAEAETLEQELLQKARDAGFDVETPEDVAPLLREYQDALDGVKSRISELDAKLVQATDRVEELEETLDEKGSVRQRLQEQITSTLEDAGVESIEEYETRIEEKRNQDRRRSEAETVLSRKIGDPDGETHAEKIADWESELEERASPHGETGVTAEQYDDEELARLEERQETLDARLQEVTNTLGEYHDTLDDYERRANELTPPPFVEVELSLQARTIQGLRTLAGNLHELVETIERNAEVSRNAIGILDSIKADEEQKIATLFDPDGPASQILSHLTNGRYSTVDYDPATETLEVRTSDDRSFTPHQLSRGTRDQLYFAARLSLAQQLLGGDSGFLLLDDPFLAADRTRLENGFETLTELADDGWQIVYLTAKREVHQTMADEFDCAVHQLELLEH